MIIDKCDTVLCPNDSAHEVDVYEDGKITAVRKKCEECFQILIDGWLSQGVTWT